MFLVSVFQNLLYKSFRIFTVLTIAVNRWIAFVVHLVMMFFVWNSLLIIIGCVSTCQMIIGFVLDVTKITSGKAALTDSTTSEKPRSGVSEYWNDRRKRYQEMIDSLYVKYMERLVDVQQQQQEYWQWQQPYQQQQYYNSNVKGNNYVDEGSINGDAALTPSNANYISE